MKITMLGSGSSSGVPFVGCECAVCTSDNPKNKRTRVSILIEDNNTRILIDTSPDLRQQCLAHGIKSVDAIVYTHAHADHVNGIDDVRSLNYHKDAVIPAYADKYTLRQLKQTFGYVFQEKPEPVWFRPALEAREIPTEPLKPFDVAGICFTPFWQKHGESQSLGFRIGNFAYSTDVNGFPEESFKQLAGLDVWIVDCLRYTPSWTHATLDMTLSWIERVKPKHAILTHMAHQCDYDTLRAELPDSVEPGYDGLIIEC